MIGLHYNVRTALTMISAVVCVALAFLWPNWRDELRAQGYLLTSPSLTLDICEVDPLGGVKVGGKVGEAAAIGELVFVSRGTNRQIVATVLGDGTFEGITTAGFGRAGQKVTVGIHPLGGKNAWLFTCELK